MPAQDHTVQRMNVFPHTHVILHGQLCDALPRVGLPSAQHGTVLALGQMHEDPIAMLSKDVVFN